MSRSTRTPVQAVRGSRVSQRLKRRIFEMPPAMVSELVETLEEGGIQPWVIGGWGVDALLGHQTRRHLDVDLAFDARDGAEGRAIAALRGLGFEVVKRESLAPSRAVPFELGARIVLDDRRRHLVDLHPVTFPADTGSAAVTAEGRIGGRPVPCLTAQLQLRLHEGYGPRYFDRADVELLRAHLGDGRPPS